MLTGKMELAYDSNQSGGYHYSLQLSPVSCSDTLGCRARTNDEVRPSIFEAAELPRRVRDELAKSPGDLGIPNDAGELVREVLRIGIRRVKIDGIL